MNILAIGAHPDDVELLCGGTLAVHVARGDTVCAAVVTGGGKGGSGTPEDETVAMRVAEFRKASDVLGVRAVGVGVAGDCRVIDSPELRGELAEVIRQAAPDVVITHCPGDYHPDHSACLAVVRGACMTAVAETPRGAGRKLGVFPQLFIMDTVSGSSFTPHFYVDISAVWETKRRALAEHKSQLGFMKPRHTDLLTMAENHAEWRGRQCGSPMAEAFRFHNDWMASRALPGLPLPDKRPGE